MTEVPRATDRSSAPAPSRAFAPRPTGGLDVWTWPVFEPHPLTAVVTTRAGGVSQGRYESLNLGLHVGDDDDPVLENRRRAAAAVGLSLGDLVFCRQSHGRRVVWVGADERGRGATSEADAVADADALVTTEPDVGLVMMVADCVPMVLYAPDAHVLACVHAGWRGTVARVAEAAVEEMVALGADPSRLVAALGPAVPAACYQVGEDVVEAAREGLGADADAVVRPDGSGRWLFDCGEANRIVLRQSGVPDAAIVVADVATGGSGPFFSDRAVRPCGRFAAIARLHDRGGHEGTPP